MAPTFGRLDQADVVLALANGTLAQLYRFASMPTMGTTTLEGTDLSTYFEKGQQITMSRPRLTGEAEDYDPRSGVDASSSEPGNVIVDLILERLFTQGYPVYSHDADPARYVRDYSEVTGDSITRAADNYLYNKGFRTWAVPASGVVRIGKHPPFALVWDETSGGALEPFSDDMLVSAKAVLGTADVPDVGRAARLSPNAIAALEKDGVLVTGFAGAMAPGMSGSQIVTSGVPMQVDVERRGFMIRGSNAVTGQAAVADLADGTPTEPISAVVADTTQFLLDDYAADTPAGAVRITVGATDPLAASVAVGKIVRLGPSSSAAKAYGVILRVDAANKYIWTIPYAADGSKLIAAQIIAGTDVVSIPAIGSVNVAAHREHLAYAARLLTPPSPGSGAIAQAAFNFRLGLVMQVLRGSYNVNQFKEGIRSAMLFGATPRHAQMGVLMLSK